MAKPEKAVVWLHGEIKSPPFSPAARLEAGVLLRWLQQGKSLAMPQSRPLPSIGPGCHEMRIRDRAANWRIFYFVDSDAIVLLEILNKSTRRIRADVIARCRRRLRDYTASR